VNATPVNVTNAVWLDPFKPLDQNERTQLEMAGISLSSVNTLGELNAALRHAHLLIIRLADSAELLQEVLTLVSQLGHSIPVLCRVDRRKMEVVVQAMRLGALHVLPSDEWEAKAWANAVQGLNVVDNKVKSYVFVDPISQHLLGLAQRVAQTEVTALLVGPTGAGKEVLARVIHETSPRSKGPFVAINCAAMPEHLIEDMLFGHEKGAFTGAQKEHKGVFEQAQGGTVFLDEIGEMPIHLQAKLLRVLQEKKLNRLGGEVPIELDIRVVAATNKDLKKAIEEREFREDLYFRISTFKLKISPLTKRPGDILPLVMQSLSRHSKDKVPYTLTPEVQSTLVQYPWPGNVRELENVVQRALVLCNGKTISLAHLMFDEAQNQEIVINPDTLLINSDGQITTLSATPQVQTQEHEAQIMAKEHIGHFDSEFSKFNSDESLKTIHVDFNSNVNKMNSGYGVPVNNGHSTSKVGNHSFNIDQGYTDKAINALENGQQNAQASMFNDEAINLSQAVKSSEHQVILAALQSTQSRTEAAQKLGISPRTLRYKLAQLRERGMSVAYSE
jgi:two-component system response regulator FlrC